MRRRLADRRPVPRFAGSTRSGMSTLSPHRSGRSVVVKTVRGGYDGRGVVLPTTVTVRPQRRWPDTSTTGVAVLARGAGPDAARTGGPGGALAVRSERSLAGGQAPFSVTGSASRWSHRAPELPDRLAAEARTAGTADRRRARRGRRAGRGAVSRPPTGALLVKRTGDAPAQLGHWTMQQRGHQPVRTASSGGAGLPARRHPGVGPGDGDGQRARERRTPRRWAWTSGLHHLMGRIPEAHVHLVRQEERPGTQIGHVNISGEGRCRGRCVERAERAAHWLSHAEWNRRMGRACLIMTLGGRDHDGSGDWPVMS